MITLITSNIRYINTMEILGTLLKALDTCCSTALIVVSISQLKSFYRQVFSMDLFLLPRDVRCLLVCILLGAVKIDKDDKEVGLSFYFTVVSFVVRMSLYKQYNQSDLTGTRRLKFVEIVRLDNVL